MRRVLQLIGASVLTLAAGEVFAQSRPSDEDIFGSADQAAAAGTSTGTGTATSTATGTSTTADKGTPPATTAIPPSTGDTRDELNLGAPDGATRFSSEVAPSDPLKIGGQLYWRAMASGKQGQEPQNWSMSAPALLDVYMDARPNDRVRAFVLGRMAYNPTLPGSVASSAGGPSSSNGDGSTSGAAGNVSAQQSDFLGSTSGQTRGPNVLLDQLWLRADIFRTVFVTAGKQHVRWGTARFWTPTDYLHVQPRNPLLPFDARTGTTMLKLHLPWEAKGWNFYAYALPNAPEVTTSSTDTFTTGDVALAARAEVVLGTAEAGVGVFGQRNSKAKFAGDVSFALWDLDFYGEAALRNAADVDFVHYNGDAVPGDTSSLGSIVDAYFPRDPAHAGWKPQVTGGVSYTRQYADKDTFTVGAEYFYNALGYSDPKVYPGLVFPRATPLSNSATFFYLGRQYVGVYATAPAPYSWDTMTFTVSTLANLTDKSGITRLDYSVVVLTHLRFEAYGAVHWGQRNGEFRFGIDGRSLPTSDKNVQEIVDKIQVPPSLFDLGVGLRVAL